MNTPPTQRKDCYQLRKAGYQMADACELCQGTDNLVIDHRIALSQGGSNEPDNLRTLCQSCNTKEGWQNRERPGLPKYTTHLTPATIREIKRYAFEHEQKDYEVVQEALDFFFQARGR
jgi:5-methylcytosine-specific restriction endonuclease McrA